MTVTCGFFSEHKMGSEWLANMRGAHLSDDKMKEIPHPKAELTIHVTTKTIQAGGLLGTVIATVACAAKKETRNLAAIRGKVTRFGRNGVLIGAVLGPVLTYMRVRNEEDPYKTWDRCYRLRHNKNQVRVDQASVVGAVTGAAAGAGVGGGALFGGLTGMVMGIFTAAIYNSVVVKKE